MDKNSPSKIHSEKIIEKFITNDDKVLEKTYQHNYKIVRSYVTKNNGTEDDAKDVFQEAMLIAWLNLKEGKFEIKNEFSLSAYIYRIAKNKWLDKLKSKRVKSTQRMGEMDYKDEGGELQEYAEAEEKLTYLTSLYGRLDAKCKEVLNQFYYQKKHLEEIATMMSYDIGSIRTIKYRCMQKLRKMHDKSKIQLTK